MPTEDRHGLTIRRLGPDDATVTNDAATADLVFGARYEGADLLVIPVDRVDPEFFRLRSGVAGEILQRAATYDLRLAFVGDVGAHEAASDAFRDLARESNRGDRVWFAPDDAALEDRLAARETGRG